MGKKIATNAQIAKALRETDGIIPRAAEKVGLARQNLHDRIKRSAELQGVLQEIEEDLRACAEGNIAKALREGDVHMTKWYAERKMRDRGYGTRVETGLEAATIEKIAEAIAQGGVAAVRAVQASLAGS